MNGTSPDSGTAQMPAAQLALVFTDIEKSTALWEKLGDAMAPVLEKHNAIIRHLSEVHRAYEVKTEGDSFFLYFEVVENALTFCLDAQQHLFDADWPEELLACPEAAETGDGLFRGLRVRMGIHCGSPIIKLDTTTGRMDLHGPVVNAASRVSSAAHGGQVLVSGRYAELIGEETFAGEAVRDHGEHRLKGMENPYRLIEILPKALEGRRFPDLNTLREIRHNLPLKPTSFIGREQEIEAIDRLVDNGHRLITVTGAGGSGKSRITLRYAASHLDRFPGGVWFMPFMDVTTLDGIAETAGGVLGIPLVREGMVGAVGQALKARGNCLVVVDNFEQIVDHASETIGIWLASAPDAVILVSSQVPLHIEGETIFPLEPLAFPLEVESDNREDLEDYPAVQLFVERARAAAPTFRSSQDNVAVVARICRHLDGIPLAIELAASRCHALTPKQIIERMPKRFAMLKGATKDLSERKSTLFGAIRWSWDLLKPWEQSAMMQTLVFNGGFTLEMAEEVIDLDVHPEADLVMDVIQNLRERNLLRSWNPTEAPEEIRFDHYESVKRFVEEQDGCGPVIERARVRYGLYCRQVVRDARQETVGGGSMSRERLRAITGNIFDFVKVGTDLIQEGALDEVIGYLEVVNNLLSRMGHLQLKYDYGKEVWNRVAREGDPDQIHSVLRNHAANPPGNAERDEVLPIIREYLDRAEGAGDIQKQVQLLSLYSLVAGDLIDNREKLEMFRKAADLARQGDSDWTLGGVLVNLISLEHQCLHHDRALETADEALEVAGRIGHQQMLALAHVNIAAVHFYIGNLSTSLAAAEEAYRMMHQIEWRTRIANILQLMAYLWFGIGDNEKPKFLLDEYRRTFREVKGSISDPRKATQLELELAIAESRWEDAERLIESPHAEEAEVEIRFMRGRVLYGRGRIDEARAAFEEAWSTTLQSKEQSIRRLEAGFGPGFRIGLSKKTGLLLHESMEVGEFDDLIFGRRLFFLDVGHYMLVMGHLALARNEAAQVVRYRDRLEELCRESTLEGTRLAPAIEGFHRSCNEYFTARDEGREPRLFRGFLPDTLDPEELTAWKLYLKPDEMAALEPSVREILLDS